MPVLGLNSILNILYYKLAIAYPELVFFLTASALILQSTLLVCLSRL